MSSFGVGKQKLDGSIVSSTDARIVEVRRSNGKESIVHNLNSLRHWTSETPLHAKISLSRGVRLWTGNRPARRLSGADADVRRKMLPQYIVQIASSILKQSQPGGLKRLDAKA
jgi:hypothetical protein